MKIIITGSSGFIGSNLVKKYIDGNSVIGFDIMPNPISSGNFEHIGFNIHDLEQVIVRYKPDLLIHCAGNADIQRSISDPRFDFSANVDLLSQILDILRKNDSKTRFINLSSAAVYGNPEELPIRESDTPEPISTYGFHKHIGEKMCTMYKQLYGLRTSSIRIFSVYGTGFKRQVIWDMSRKIVNHADLVLFGTGNESRDFIHIEDLVDAIDLIANDPNEEDVYNVGTGQEITIRELTNLFNVAMGKDCRWSFNNQTRKGDPVNWCSSIRKIQNLGFKQKISIENGIKEIYEWSKTIK